jgi:hypothetical protein
MNNKIIVNDPTIARLYTIPLDPDYMERYELRSDFVNELITLITKRFCETMSPSAQQNGIAPYKGIHFKVIEGSPFLLREIDIPKLQKLQENMLNPENITPRENKLMSDASAKPHTVSNNLTLKDARILFSPE